jgi:hypothetical protein
MSSAPEWKKPLNELIVCGNRALGRSSNDPLSGCGERTNLWSSGKFDETDLIALMRK